MFEVGPESYESGSLGFLLTAVQLSDIIGIMKPLEISDKIWRLEHNPPMFKGHWEFEHWWERLWHWLKTGDWPEKLWVGEGLLCTKSFIDGVKKWADGKSK